MGCAFQFPISNFQLLTRGCVLFERSEWTPDRVAILSRNAALILLGGVVVGLFAASAHLYYVGAAIAAAALAIIIVWQFDATLMLYCLVAFIPFGETPDLAVGGSGAGKGVFVSEIMLGSLLVVWFGKYMLRALPYPRIRSGFHVPIAFYLAYAVLNVVNSFLFWDSTIDKSSQSAWVNIAELAIHFLSAGAFVMLATSVTSGKWLKAISIAIIAAGVYNTVNALAGRPLPLAAPWWPLLAILPLAYCWVVVLDQERSALWRVLAGLGVAAIFCAAFFRNIGWISGWIGLVPAMAVISYVRNRKVFIALVIGVPVLIFGGKSFLHEKVVHKVEISGDLDRLSLLQGGWKYATTFPLGVGLGNYRSYNYHYGQKWGTTTYSSAHNTYAQHLSEMGIPGTILFLAILIGGFTWMMKTYPKMHPGFSKTFMLAAIGQMAGISVAAAVGDYIIPTYHNGGLTTFSTTIYSWLIWGLAVAHARIDGMRTDGPVDSDR